MVYKMVQTSTQRCTLDESLQVGYASLLHVKFVHDVLLVLIRDVNINICEINAIASDATATYVHTFIVLLLTSTYSYIK